MCTLYLSAGCLYFCFEILALPQTIVTPTRMIMAVVLSIMLVDIAISSIKVKNYFLQIRLDGQQLITE